MGRAIALLRAAHPEPVLVVTVLAGVLALAAGRGWGTLAVVGAVGLGHLAIGWSNDWLDLPSDRASGRTDKPLVRGDVAPEVVAVAIVVALVAHLPLALLSGVPATMALLGAEAVAFAYNAGLKDLPASVAAYAFSFGVLPSVITLGLTPPRLPAGWVFLAAALLGVAGHLTQVLADLPGDRRRGSHGLPQLLGRVWSVAVAVLALVAAVVVVVVGAHLALLLGVVLIVAAVGLGGVVVVAVRSGRDSVAFRVTLVLACVVVVGLVLGGARITS